MKKFVGIFLACAAGTLVALQVNGWMQKRNQTPLLEMPMKSGLDGRPVSGELLPTPPDFKAASKKILKSVVAIDIAQRGINWSGQEVVSPVAQGSGVILSNAGYIVTNNHVVRYPNGQVAEIVRVHTTNNDVFDAKVVGTDPRSDLAVLKVDATNLAPVEIGNSKTLEIGEWVIAAGNPLGYENTVSVGVVSSLGRSVDLTRGGEGNYLINAIQTDAAINPGNSGGALVNAQGQLIGINSAIASNTGGSVGIGFAIPVDRVQRVTQDIIKYGHARYGQLGVFADQRPDLLRNPEVRQELQGLVGAQPPAKGLIVLQVGEKSPAAEVGLARFDVLLSVDNQEMRMPIDLQKVLADKQPGDQVEVKYWQRGQTKTAKIALRDLSNP